MKKIKFDKTAILTIVSAVCGVGGFIANVLSKEKGSVIVSEKKKELLSERLRFFRKSLLRKESPNLGLFFFYICIANYGL